MQSSVAVLATSQRAACNTSKGDVKTVWGSEGSDPPVALNTDRGLGWCDGWRGRSGRASSPHSKNPLGDSCSSYTDRSRKKAKCRRLTRTERTSTRRQATPRHGRHDGGRVGFGSRPRSRMPRRAQAASCPAHGRRGASKGMVRLAAAFQGRQTPVGHGSAARAAVRTLLSPMAPAPAA